MAFPTSGMIGTEVTQTQTAAEGEAFAVGTHVLGSDETEFVYIECTGAIAQFDCVAIDEDHNALPITNALAAAGHGIGFAQIAIALGEFGWVATRGSNISVTVAASAAKDVQIYTTATAGSLDDTATSTATLLRGVVLATTNGTASTTSVEVRAVFPSGTATP